MAQATMDYGGVDTIATGFQASGETLQVVSKVLEAAIAALTVAAFISFGTTEFLKKYLENIKPKVDTLAATCLEMSDDLQFAIQQHQEADENAAPKFS